jgi:DNA polymerase-3 subunit delta'
MNGLDKLLLNPRTRSQVELFLAKPTHALLLSGPPGGGKYTLATQMAANLLDSSHQSIHTDAYYLEVKRPDNKTETSIDAVRDLISRLSLRVPADKSKNINRVVLISEADKLTTEAQNALLKVLEEPPAKTSIILTTDSETNLLPTILSRLQKINVISPSLEQALIGRDS